MYTYHYHAVHTGNPFSFGSIFRIGRRRPGGLRGLGSRRIRTEVRWICQRHNI